jgi:hypothetical protein
MNTVVNMPAAATSDGTDAPLADARPRVAPDRHRQHRDAARSEAAAASAPHSPFVPLLLGGLAVMGWLGFQAQQQLTEREALATAHASQQQTVDNAAKLRASLDALAADTQRMAQAGNPNARLLVEELARRGVTINPGAAQGTGPVAGAALPATPPKP